MDLLYHLKLKKKIEILLILQPVARISMRQFLIFQKLNFTISHETILIIFVKYERRSISVKQAEINNPRLPLHFKFFRSH